MDTKTYTTTEVAERLGVTARKVKYYCGQGLVPGIRRTASGRRELTEEQVNFLSTLIWLRRCGFSMGKVRKFAALQREGDATKERRVAILKTLKQQVWQDYEELQTQVDFLERQIAWLEEKR